MRTVEDLTDLKEKVERLRREADKAAGALGQAMKQLEKDFDCKTLETAQMLLKVLEKKEIKSKESFDKAIRKFEENWKEELV